MSAPAPPVQVRYGLLDVAVALQLQDAPGGATAVARSGLYPDGRRGIRVWLCPSHLIVSRALHRADALVIRFVVGLALVEYCSYWRQTRDGTAVNRALKRMADIQPGQEAWGSGYASKLASSSMMRVVDALPIFTKTPQAGPFDLFTLTIEGRTPDLHNWRVRDDETESVRPIPKSPRKPKLPSAVGVPPPDPFLHEFHMKAKELLSDADYAMIVEMTREEEVAPG